MEKKWRSILSISLLICFTTSLQAQEENPEKKQEEGPGTIATDRPVQSETPSTVPHKHIQLEVGGQYTSGLAEGQIVESNLYDGALLLKYGLFERMEFRLSTNYNSTTNKLEDKTITPALSEERTQSGISSPQIGFKFKVLDQKDWKPDITFSTQSRIPIWGDSTYRASRWNYQLRLTMGKAIVGNWYIIAGAELNYLPEQKNEIFYVLQTGYSFFDKLTLVGEFYSYQFPETNVTQNALNYALVYLLKDNHQVDLSFGHGLGDNFYNHYLAVGYSIRIPN